MFKCQLSVLECIGLIFSMNNSIREKNQGTHTRRDGIIIGQDARNGKSSVTFCVRFIKVACFKPYFAKIGPKITISIFNPAFSKDLDFIIDMQFLYYS